MIEYRNLRGTVKNRTKNEFKLYQQNIENNVNVDPSSFWTYVKAKSKQNGIPQVMNLGNNSFSEHIYKGCIDILVKPLVHIFNLSIKTCTYANPLKNSVISPIPKACKAQNNIKHFRPIKFLHSFCKYCFFSKFCNKCINK